MEIKIDKNKAIIIVLVLVILAIAFKNNSRKAMHIVSPDESSQKQENSEELPKQELEEDESFPQTIKVYVSGQVKTCGVVEIESSARLVDAIEKLGGLAENADMNRVNLAQKLEDGGHYIVVGIGEEIPIQQQVQYSQGQQAQAGGGQGGNDGKVDINCASESELNQLPGIGDVIAQRIVEYREQNGSFKSIEDIKNVSGIGDKKFEGISDLIEAR